MISLPGRLCCFILLSFGAIHSLFPQVPQQVGEMRINVIHFRKNGYDFGYFDFALKVMLDKYVNDDSRVLLQYPPLRLHEDAVSGQKSMVSMFYINDTAFLSDLMLAPGVRPSGLCGVVRADGVGDLLNDIKDGDKFKIESSVQADSCRVLVGHRSDGGSLIEWKLLFRIEKCTGDLGPYLVMYGPKDSIISVCFADKANCIGRGIDTSRFEVNGMLPSKDVMTTIAEVVHLLIWKSRGFE